MSKMRKTNDGGGRRPLDFSEDNIEYDMTNVIDATELFEEKKYWDWVDGQNDFDIDFFIEIEDYLDPEMMTEDEFEMLLTESFTCFQEEDDDDEPSM